MLIFHGTCQGCGTEFEGIHGNQKYCDPRCRERSKYYYRIYGQRRPPVYKKRCRWCSEEFEFTQKGRVYCSPACLIEGARERRMRFNRLYRERGENKNTDPEALERDRNRRNERRRRLYWASPAKERAKHRARYWLNREAKREYSLMYNQKRRRLEAIGREFLRQTGGEDGTER